MQKATETDCFSGFFVHRARGEIRTPTPVGHHPLKMACLPVSPRAQTLFILTKAMPAIVTQIYLFLSSPARLQKKCLVAKILEHLLSRQ